MAHKSKVQATVGSLNEASAGSGIVLLESAMRAESGSVLIESEGLEEARGLLLVLDITGATGIDPTLDVALFPQFGDWSYRMLQWTQQTAVGRIARLIRRDGATMTDALALLDAVPEPAAASGYVKDGMPWSRLMAVSYRISGTFAPGDPGPPPVPAEGITFSVTAFPIQF